MPGSERRRAVLFVLVCAALCASALALAATGENSAPPAERGADERPSAPPAPVDVLRRAAARVQRLRGEVRGTARRFLAAFLRYEVGGEGAGVRAALRATSTRGFAARLLAAPPRPASGEFPPPARLAKLGVSFLSGPSERALVSGVARRGAAPEQLSFVFVRTPSGWRAAGPGQ